VGSSMNIPIRQSCMKQDVIVVSADGLTHGLRCRKESR
jgi:hypothetical protein